MADDEVPGPPAASTEPAAEPSAEPSAEPPAEPPTTEPAAADEPVPAAAATTDPFEPAAAPPPPEEPADLPEPTEPTDLPEPTELTELTDLTEPAPAPADANLPAAPMSPVDPPTPMAASPAVATDSTGSPQLGTADDGESGGGSPSSATAVKLSGRLPELTRDSDSATTALHEAVATGDPGRIRQALDFMGATAETALTSLNGDGWLPIHYAAINPVWQPTAAVSFSPHPSNASQMTPHCRGRVGL